MSQAGDGARPRSMAGQQQKRTWAADRVAGPAVLVAGLLCAALSWRSPSAVGHLMATSSFAFVFFGMVQWRRRARSRGRSRRLFGSWEVAAGGLLCLAVGGSAALSPTAIGLQFSAAAGVGFVLLLTGTLAAVSQRYPGRTIHVSVAAVSAGTTTAALSFALGLGNGLWGAATTAMSSALAAATVVVCAGLLFTTRERLPAQWLAFLGSLLVGAAYGALFTPLLDARAPGVFSGLAVAGYACWAAAGVHRSIDDSFDAVDVGRTIDDRRTVGVVVGAIVVANGALIMWGAQASDDVNGARVTAAALVAPAVLIGYLLSQLQQHRSASGHGDRDELTGLASRGSFENALRLGIARARRSGDSVAVMFLDLDRFKDVNDSLGHAEGNRLLRDAAKRLSGALRECDVAARFGGDEFAAVCGDLSRDDDGREVAARIVEAFAKPFRLARRDVYVTASVGMSVFPYDASDAEALVANADAAMYQAKSQGRNTLVVFSPDITEVAKQRVVIQSELHNAIKRNELELHYQPKLHIASGRVTGVEALVRWRHPERGLLGPDRFIEIAEEFAMIAEIGKWVLEEACRELRRMQLSGFAGMSVAVNVSPGQFKVERMADVVSNVLERTGIDAANLELELTEGIAIDASDETIADLFAIGRLGVCCSIDDFGTGYSSLSYLTRLPFRRLKIDKSFVMRLGASASSDDAAVIRAIIAMAHSLGLQVVAEGVETEEQMSFLRGHGCDYAQGYLVSPPLATGELERFLMLQQVAPRAAHERAST